MGAEPGDDVFWAACQTAGLTPRSVAEEYAHRYGPMCFQTNSRKSVIWITDMGKDENGNGIVPRDWNNPNFFIWANSIQSVDWYTLYEATEGMVYSGYIDDISQYIHGSEALECLCTCLFPGTPEQLYELTGVEDPVVPPSPPDLPSPKKGSPTAAIQLLLLR